MSDVVTGIEILNRAQAVFASNDAINLSTTGGRYSPWILGAYFANIEHDPVMFLETNGRSIENIRANPNVAFVVSRNDAMQDFVQASAVAELLPPEAEADVRARLVAKMPWFKTYTPVVPVRLRVKQLFVTSIKDGWLPAKRVDVGG